MMDVIRNWLLGIMKQAIREVEREDTPVMDPQLAEVVNSLYSEQQKGAATWVYGWPSPGGSSLNEEYRAVSRRQPVSFEDEQNQALKAQDEFWAKKVPSDV